MPSRRYLIGGNWKSNGTLSSNKQLVDALNKLSVPDSTDVVVAPVFIHIPSVQQQLNNKYIQVAAQNCSPYKQGAHTGEVAADQLADSNIHWVILGHSERRQEFSESDETIAKKVKLALESNLHIIACVGETLDQRESNQQIEVVTKQLNAIKSSVQQSQWVKHIVIAYEPVWAIGTGKNATAEQAQEMHKSIRQWMSKNVSDDVAQGVRILYGGSVKGANAGELMEQPDVDGFLVGGASLKADDFTKIVQSTQVKSKL